MDSRTPDDGDSDTPNQEVTMDGAALIAAERQRQVDAEGYDHAHDDAHDQGELALAAGAYCVPEDAHTLWPWDMASYKPRDPGPGRVEVTPAQRIHDLTRAGALLAAEIDRLQRLVT